MENAGTGTERKPGEGRPEARAYLAELVELVGGKEVATAAANPIIQDLAGYPLRAFEARYFLAFLEAAGTFDHLVARPGLLLRRAPVPGSDLEALICEPADQGEPFKVQFRPITLPAGIEPRGVFNLGGMRLLPDKTIQPLPEPPEHYLGWGWSRPTTKERARHGLEPIAKAFPDAIHYYTRRTAKASEIVAEAGQANGETLEIPQGEAGSLVFLYKPILETDALPVKPEPVRK